LLLSRQQHFDLYAYSARRAPLGRWGWPDRSRTIATNLVVTPGLLHAMKALARNS
jgi:hypothetical protein